MSDIRDIKGKDFFRLETNKEKIKFLLQYAVLAPSTHNSQPWLFKINEDSCEIYKNINKEIPIGDKIGRDLFISIGCILENLIQAALYYNIYKNYIYRINSKNNLIVEVFFKNLDKSIVNQNKSYLLNAIQMRANKRGIFKAKLLPTHVFTKLKILAKRYPDVKLHLVTKSEDRKQLSDLTAEGMKYAYKNPKFRKEMSEWFINNYSSKKEGIPGYSINLPDLISIFFPYIVRFFNIGPVVAKLNRISVGSAPLIIVITSKKNNPISWLQVGRLAERIMLELVNDRIKTSIYVASIEMGKLYKKVQKILRTKEIPQFLFSAGYIDGPKKFTPRHPVEHKIIPS